ncbi:MAG: peptidylprolyl isomerase [Desulfobacterales bacterium]|nr:peptidylprolyl isomerase [Desulfobacterales bacterium]MBS3755150.1 peptidylprolyl isomerase [Desulfobacterales bacterium]
MEKVESGKFVTVNYKGTLESGEVFDSSEDGQPMEVKVGSGQVIQGFENALMGMELNEEKSFTLEPDEAYGSRDENQLHTFSRQEVPPEMNPQVGDVIGLQTPDGQQIPAKIAETDEEKVVVDLNHPLAGEKLNFEIQVVDISDTPTQMSADCSSGGCDCSSGCC